MACGHRICELAGEASGGCSLASGRSRGCHAVIAERQLADGVVDEVRALLATIETADGERGREAAVRLAAMIRREARDERNLAALVGEDAPELAPALARLCVRRTS